MLRRSIPSPRETLLPHLSAKQAAALAYPPNIFPGSRDVDTPYGAMRVYEWGPEQGRKVLLIHGDTTPGPMMGPIAHQLVECGCRVMILGMFMISLSIVEPAIGMSRKSSIPFDSHDVGFTPSTDVEAVMHCCMWYQENSLTTFSTRSMGKRILGYAS